MIETPKTEKLYTFEEVAPMFQVTPRTVRRWWAQRKKFKPTPNTVRITQSQLELFIKDSCRQPITTKK